MSEKEILNPRCGRKIFDLFGEKETEKEKEETQMEKENGRAKKRKREKRTTQPLAR